MVNIFITTNEIVDYSQAISSGEAIFVTYNDPMVNRSTFKENVKGDMPAKYYPRMYVDYDNIPYDRLNKTIENIDDIVAVEVNTDLDTYYVDLERFSQEIYGKDRNIYKILPDLYDEESETKRLTQPFKPMTQPFLSNIDLPKVNDYKNSDFKYYWEEHKASATNSINLFHIIDKSWQIPLIYGNSMKELNDIVIDLNTAKLWQSLYDIADIESLIGQNIELRLCTYATELYLPFDFGEVIADEDYDFFERYTYRITGITNLKNNDMRMAFVNGSILEDQILARLVINSEGLDFKDVKFILSPGTNYEEASNQINELMGLTKTSFIQKNKVTTDNIKLDRNNNTLIAYLAITTIILFAVYYLNLLMNRKTYFKEQRLLKEYGYHNKLIEIIKLVLLMIMTAILVFVISQFVFAFLNKVMRSIGYSLFLDGRLSYLIIAVIFVTVIQILLTLSVQLTKDR